MVDIFTYIYIYICKYIYICDGCFLCHMSVGYKHTSPMDVVGSEVQSGAPTWEGLPSFTASNSRYDWKTKGLED